MSTPVTLLGANQYGKAEVRLVRVTRDTDRHEVEDLSVTSQLRGDFEAAHTVGDNTHVVTTDTQKNTVYAFAREHGVGSPERFLLTLGRHFVDGFDWVTGGRWHAEQYTWSRIGDHDHAFVRSGQETRTCVVQIEVGATYVVSGLTDCVVAKTTGSEFTGFPRDRYTTLAETTDRILATSVTAWWRYAPSGPLDDLDFNALYDGIRSTLLATFADLHSLALQQTLFALGTAVIEGFPDVAECRFSMPNKHHFLVDLEPFGLSNPGEVFYAADRPYGLIEGAVLREGAAPAEAAWRGTPGFC